MKRHKQYFVPVIVLLLLIVGVFAFWRQKDKPTNTQNTAAYAANSTPASNQPTDTPKTTFDKMQYSIDDPKSIWVVVNKHRPLPVGYAPSDLVVPNVALRLGSGADEMHVRQVTATAMKELFDAASAAGVPLRLASGYRSEATQKALHASYAAQKGDAAADLDSARAGFSEHQTGFAADLEPSNRTCEVDPCFANTPAGKWLAVNAYRYGFVIRYQPNKQAVTGYIYEPWHVRYVGKDLAKAVYNSGETATLEEFFGLPAAPDYL